MNAKSIKFFRKIYIIFLVLFYLPLQTYSQNVVIVIIDGARYSETFGDPNRTYIPKMDSLAQYGTYIDEFYNDSLTYTSRAIPALWCGAWTGVQDTFYNGRWTQYTLKPTLFEYFRKYKQAPSDQCYYVLKYIASLWLPSFHSDYGPNYWPTFQSMGSTDNEVLSQALFIMNTYHPRLNWIYFADVDSYGHGGNWNNYTQAIQNVDDIVGIIWHTIQSDSIYKNNTYMFVTNDHGRHDSAHGGFQGHGDGCDGCRHIMYLALGPTVKQNFVSTVNRVIPDMTVTIGNLLNFNTEHATGSYMEEIFEPVSIGLDLNKKIPDKSITANNYPNPFNPITTISYKLSSSDNVSLDIFNITGQKIISLVKRHQPPGNYKVRWDGRDEQGQSVPSGIYLYKLSVPNYSFTGKAILLK